MPVYVQDLKRSCKNLHKKRLDTSLAGHYSKYGKTYADDDNDDDEDADNDVRCIDVCNSLTSFAS